MSLTPQAIPGMRARLHMPEEIYLCQLLVQA